MAPEPHGPLVYLPIALVIDVLEEQLEYLFSLGHESGCMCCECALRMGVEKILLKRFE